MNKNVCQSAVPLWLGARLKHGNQRQEYDASHREYNYK